MKKVLLLSSILLTSLLSHLSSQTCTGLYYRDFIFADSSQTNVVYGSNISSSNATTSLKMDVWMPKADTTSTRPLIIIMHGGNFLGGSKSGTDVLQFAKDFAKMGYVAVSIDYRVGMTNFPFPGPDSVDAAGAVIRAVHDAKAAIRYFKKDVITNGNHYRVDTTNIFFLGVSAGAIAGLHLAYMDNMSEFPLYADTTNNPGLHGGLEGLSGNQGYSSSFRGVIELCGAIGDTSWIAPGNMPAMMFHGDVDQTVPYGSAVITLLGQYPLLTVDGSHSIDIRLTNLGIEHCFETWEGQDHVPEVGTTSAALAYYDSALVMSRNFLVHFVCGDPLQCQYTTNVAVNNLPALPSLVEVYPNPATSSFTIDANRLAGEDFTYTLYSSTGQLVRSEKLSANGVMKVNTEDLPSGIYLLTLRNSESVYTQRIVIQ